MECLSLYSGGETTGLWVEFKNHDAEMRKKLQKTEVSAKTPLKTPMKPSEMAVLQEIRDQMTQKMALKTTQKMALKTLELLILNPKITISELAQKTDKSERTVKRMLQKLQKEEYLKRIGPDKGGYWQVMKKDRK